MFSGCYYGGSKVECESLLDTSRYICKASGENTDVCFDAIFESGIKENRCIEENEYNTLVEFNKKINDTIVDTEITNENFGQATKHLTIAMTCFVWVVFFITSLFIAFDRYGVYREKHLTITLIFVCLLFPIIGPLILYLVDKTREEIKDRKKPQ